MRLFWERTEETRYGDSTSWPTKQRKKPKLGVQELDTEVCRQKALYGPVVSHAAWHPRSFLLY